MDDGAADANDGATVVDANDDHTASPPPDAAIDRGVSPTTSMLPEDLGSDFVWTLSPGTPIGEPPSVAVPATFMTAGQTSCASGPVPPSSCGTAGAAACPTGFCACTGGPTCVQTVGLLRCPTSLARIDDNRCVDDLRADERHYVEPDNNDGICEEFKSIQPECGGFQTDGGAGSCGSRGFCSCHEHRCVAHVARTDCASGYAFATTGRCVDRKAPSCPTGLAWASDGACIDGDPAAAVTATIAPDGLRCSAAPIKRCGVEAASGGVLRCDPTTEVCVCKGHDRCARLAPDVAACPSRLSWADDGTCVQGLTIAELAVAQPNADGLCPDDRIPLPECGSATQKCPDGSRCLCREQRCAARVPPEICPSRAVWTSSNRCVGLPAELSRCPSGLAWESDNTCIVAPAIETIGAQLAAARPICPGFELPDAGNDQ
jgi:hypothetical protein